MLVCSCLEAVGTLARALQGGLTCNGRLLRAVLLPVLERLTDPCSSVAASAAAAISSLCFHGGYATFGQLVAANADYIVDGLCKQLRRLSDHPMSVLDSCVLLMMLAYEMSAATFCPYMRGRQAALICRRKPLLMAMLAMWLLVCSTLHTHLLPPTDEVVHVALLHTPICHPVQTTGSGLTGCWWVVLQGAPPVCCTPAGGRCGPPSAAPAGRASTVSLPRPLSAQPRQQAPPGCGFSAGKHFMVIDACSATTVMWVQQLQACRPAPQCRCRHKGSKTAAGVTFCKWHPWHVSCGRDGHSAWWLGSLQG